MFFELNNETKTVTGTFRNQAEFDYALAELRPLLENESLNHEWNLSFTFYSGKFYLYGELHLKCNVIFKGVITDKFRPSLLIDKSVITKDIHTSNPDNSTQTPGSPLLNKGSFSIIEFGDIDGAVRTNCKIEDLRIAVSGDSGDISDNALFQRHLISIHNADKCEIFNTDIIANNGQVTLIDIREANDIVIENCSLFNDTVSNDNTNLEGGVMFIRGAFNSCRIAKNHFMYYGSDEMIAVTPHDGAEGWWRKVLIRENFELIDNKIIYGHYPSGPGTVTDHEAAMPVYHSCDKLITFISSNEKKTEQHADTSEYPIGTMTTNIWKNFRIAGNEMDLYDRVQYVIHIAYMEQIDELRNFIIEDNRIHHHATHDNRTETGLPVCDFFAGGTDNLPDYDSGSVDPIILKNNRISSNEQFKNGAYHKYRFIELSGCKVKSIGNIYNASGCISYEDSERCTYAISATNFGGSYSFEGDVFLGISNFGSLSHGSKIVKPIDGKVLNCFIDGSIAAICKNVTSLNLELRCNYIKNTSFYFLGQRFGKLGSLIVSDNIWDFNTAGNYAFYFPEGNNDTLYSLSVVMVCNNQFVKQDIDQTDVHIDTPSASRTIIRNNKYLTK